MDDQQHPPNAADIPEGTPHLELDLVLRWYERIATTFWEGFLRHGKAGIIHVVVRADDVRIEYCTPCVCHAEMVAGLDPESQIAVLVDTLNEEGMFIINGEPKARVVFEQARAEVLASTVH